MTNERQSVYCDMLEGARHAITATSFLVHLLASLHSRLERANQQQTQCRFNTLTQQQLLDGRCQLGV